MKCTLHERKHWQMQTTTGTDSNTIFFQIRSTNSLLFVFFFPTNRIWFGLSRILKEAEANRLKLTPEYLELRFIESIANNSKIFFGEKVLTQTCYVCFFLYGSSSHGLSCELLCRFLT